MLLEKPQWTFSSQRPLTQWYGHVQLLPGHALGQWFCVDRASGALQWQRTLFRPNTICGIDSGVIVAAETRSDGPWTATFGCYGISLEDGRRLWTSHGSALWGRLGRLLDFVPGFTNEFRDTPHHVQNGKVICASGRVLDVQTGRLLERIAPEEVQAYQEPRTLAQRFYDNCMDENHPQVSIGEGVALRHVDVERGLMQSGLDIAAEAENGRPLWKFSTDQLGRHIRGNFYSYRLVLPFLYLVVSDEPQYKPHPTREYCVLPNPTRWHFVTLELATGDVIQDFPLDDAPLTECRIEDVDDQGLLIGKSSHELAYYRRTA